MKKISFIIPAYNAEKVIDKCIQSIIKIDYNNYEIVVVNDGSTDYTEEIIKSYNDARLKVITQKNSGVSTARNRGLLEASGEYIAFVDADDTLESKAYETFLKSDKFEKYNFVMFGYEIVNAGNVTVNLPLPAGEYGKHEANKLAGYLFDIPFSQNYISHYMGGKIYQYLWKKSFLMENRILFDSNIHFGEDCLYCLKCFQAADRFEVLDKWLYNYYVYSESASHRYRENLWEEWMNIYNLAEEISGRKLKNRNEILFYHGRELIRRILLSEGEKNKKEILSAVKKVVEKEELQNALRNISFANWTMKEKLLLQLFKCKAEYLIVILYALSFRIKREQQL